MLEVGDGRVDAGLEKRDGDETKVRDEAGALAFQRAGGDIEIAARRAVAAPLGLAVDGGVEFAVEQLAIRPPQARKADAVIAVRLLGIGFVRNLGVDHKPTLAVDHRPLDLNVVAVTERAIRSGRERLHRRRGQRALGNRLAEEELRLPAIIEKILCDPRGQELALLQGFDDTGFGDDVPACVTYAVHWVCNLLDRG
jgi:hypothetical protein